jgi:hypothetical protein
MKWLIILIFMVGCNPDCKPFVKDSGVNIFCYRADCCDTKNYKNPDKSVCKDDSRVCRNVNMLEYCKKNAKGKTKTINFDPVQSCLDKIK